MLLRSNRLTEIVDSIPDSSLKSTITLGFSGAKAHLNLTEHNSVAGGNINTRSSIGEQALLVADMLKESISNEKDFKAIIKKSSIMINEEQYPLLKVLNAATVSEKIAESTNGKSLRQFISTAHKKNPSIDRGDSLNAFKKTWLDVGKMSGMEGIYLQLNNSSYVEKIGNYLKEPENLIVFSPDAKTCGNFMGGASVFVVGKECESPQNMIASAYHLDFLEKKVAIPQMIDTPSETALAKANKIMGSAIAKSFPMMEEMVSQIKGREWDATLINQAEFMAFKGVASKISSISSPEDFGAAIQELYSKVGETFTSKQYSSDDYSPSM